MNKPTSFVCSILHHALESSADLKSAISHHVNVLVVDWVEAASRNSDDQALENELKIVTSFALAQREANRMKNFFAVAHSNDQNGKARPQKLVSCVSLLQDAR